MFFLRRSAKIILRKIKIIYMLMYMYIHIYTSVTYQDDTYTNACTHIHIYVHVYTYVCIHILGLFLTVLTEQSMERGNKKVRLKEASEACSFVIDPAFKTYSSGDEVSSGAHNLSKSF